MSVHTIDALTCLKPGERLVYYRGKLPSDYVDCATDTPVYASVLRSVYAAAVDLANRGRIVLSEKPHARKAINGRRVILLTEYVATGKQT